MKTPRLNRDLMIKPLLLSGALLLSPLALAQSEEAQAQREALRAELEAARTELAQAAREMARLQRELVEEGAREGRWAMKTEGGDGENVEIIIDSEHDVQFFGTTPKLGILVAGGSDSENEVLGLTPGGGAEAAGLQRGDRVVLVNGIALDSETSIADALSDVEAGTAVTVTVERDGESLDFQVETSAPDRDIRAFAYRFGPEMMGDIDIDIDMEALHEGLEAAEREIVILREQGLIPPDAPNAPHPPRLPGLFVLGGDSDLISNHDGLAPYFGTGDGVVVLRIGSDNPLQLADGDVILSIDGTAVSRPADLGRAMLDRAPGDTVLLELMRNGTLTQVEGTVPESRFPGLRIKREMGLHAPEAPHAPRAPRPPRPGRAPASTY